MTTRLLLAVALLLLAACATKPTRRLAQPKDAPYNLSPELIAEERAAGNQQLVLPHPLSDPRQYKFPDAR